MKPYNTAVIFAGGKSSRMGKDKALLPFGEHTSLTAFQYEKLQTLFHTVYISTKEAKFDFHAPLIKDAYNESSPLVGLLSIFEKCDVQDVFILSVDAPFVDATTIDKIMKIDISEYDAVVAESPSGIQPLCGRYKKSILPLLKKHLKEGNHKLQHLLRNAKTYSLHFEEDSVFTNINYPEEYEKALERLF